MAQHATIHGKTTTETNGQTGIWIPIQANNSGQMVIAPINGELSQFNRLAAGAICSHSVVISADGIVVNGPAILYSIKVVTAGTNITVYDNTAASGTAVITTEGTATAGALLYPAGPGVGVLMNTGIYCDLTLGTYIFNYVAVA